MTVSELIDELQKFPPDALILRGSGPLSAEAVHLVSVGTYSEDRDGTAFRYDAGGNLMVLLD